MAASGVRLKVTLKLETWSSSVGWQFYAWLSSPDPRPFLRMWCFLADHLLQTLTTLTQKVPGLFLHEIQQGFWGSRDKKR